ncbi:MAG: WhiB family transcriptional regulator [Candidatus Microsaccharimonas sp.]
MEQPKKDRIIPVIERESITSENGEFVGGDEETELETWLTIGQMARLLEKSYDWVEIRVKKYFLDYGEIRLNSRGKPLTHYPNLVYDALKLEKDSLKDYPVVNPQDISLDGLSVAIGKTERWIRVRTPYLEINGTTKLNPINNRLFTYYSEQDKELLLTEVERMNQYPVAGEDDSTVTGLARLMGHDAKWIHRRLAFIHVEPTIKLNPLNYQLALYFPTAETISQIENLPSQYPIAGDDDSTERGLAQKSGKSLTWVQRRLAYTVITPTIKLTPENFQPRRYYPTTHTIEQMHAIPSKYPIADENESTVSGLAKIMGHAPSWVHRRLRYTALVPSIKIHPRNHQPDLFYPIEQTVAMINLLPEHIEHFAAYEDLPVEHPIRKHPVQRQPIEIRTMNGIDLVTVDNWREFAECATTDPEIFLPQKGESTRDAKKICGRCAARLFCLDYAVATKQEGIWGGTSDRERRAIRKGQT